MLTVARVEPGIYVSVDVEFVREGAFWKFYDDDPSDMVEYFKRMEEKAARATQP